MAKFSTKKLVLTCLTIGALLFSFFLMFHTFSYDGKRQEMRIASKAWSDFGAHIPLIRSFSYGPNLARLLTGQPVQSPLFPGEPVRYHFGFYAIVGLLERLGLRIDWALNIPSVFGFFLLLLLIFRFSQLLFTSYPVAILSVLFFLFNGSLSFLQFFKTHSIAEIVTNSRFPSFGPWDGGPITAFWTLNIYTNQRHLALSYALVLVIIWILLSLARRNAVSQHRHGLDTMTVSKKNDLDFDDARTTASRLRRVIVNTLILSMGLSLLLFINYAAAAIAILFLLWFFIVHKPIRLVVAMSLILMAPAAFLLTRYTNLSSPVTWQPGYLSHGNIASFWWQNFGAHLILIPLGIVLSPKRIRHMFFVPMLLLFLLPNLFRFSSDMINNHKFFNFFMILGNMFSAYAITQIFSFKMKRRGIKLFQFIATSTLIILLTLSGIIDFFPIINDYKGGIPDIAANPDARFIANNTQPTDIIANSTWFYHPASLAGRAIYSGYTYFTWSYGYDQGGRERLLESIYRASNQRELCQKLQELGIAYIELNQQPETYLQPNWDLWNSLSPVYENPETKLKIYAAESICRNEEINLISN